MKLKRLNQIIILILVLSISNSCKLENTKVEFSLENISNSKLNQITKNGNSLNIELIDSSNIYFKNYHDLKFDIIINENYENLKDFEYLKLSCKQVGRPEIQIKNYSTKDINKIKNKFSNNYSKRNLYFIVNNFNATEFWNLDYTIYQFSEYIKDSKKYTYEELIVRHSEFQNGERKDSTATKRIELARDYFKEKGMQKAWNEQDIIIDASELVEKLNYIIKN